MIYMFLAEGFEEIEAVAPLGILRRAGKQVETVAVATVGNSDNTVASARGVKLVADVNISEVELNADVEMIILPGGMPGVKNLYASDKVKAAVNYCAENGIFIAAICAAPMILGRENLLNGKTATCYPGFEKDLAGANVSTDSVVVDGKIITAKSAGASLEFGFKLVEVLAGTESAEKIRKAMLHSFMP